MFSLSFKHEMSTYYWSAGQELSPKKKMSFWHSAPNSNTWDLLQAFSNTSWVSYNSNPLGHYLPGGSIRCHRLGARSYRIVPSSPPQTPSTSLGGHLCLWPTSYRSEVPTTPSEGRINVLERLTGIREGFYSLDHQFAITGYNSGTAHGDA